ncbi:hypothetical protein [Brevibacillus reuszeri]|uniref:hypothetical protein n=1 Tax=Brevibacillus reuszeri TaxID=54915 RepID=UPI00289AED17|nr:hypothetical protein [Brevibacillus reuszeri]
MNEDNHRLSELTAKIEVASWYSTLTDAMVEAITAAAHAGMPVQVAHQVMRAAMSTAMPDAIVVSKGKSTPHPSKPVRDVL